MVRFLQLIWGELETKAFSEIVAEHRLPDKEGKKEKVLVLAKNQDISTNVQKGLDTRKRVLEDSEDIILDEVSTRPMSVDEKYLELVKNPLFAGVTLTTIRRVAESQVIGQEIEKLRANSELRDCPEELLRQVAEEKIGIVPEKKNGSFHINLDVRIKGNG